MYPVCVVGFVTRWLSPIDTVWLWWVQHLHYASLQCQSANVPQSSRRNCCRTKHQRRRVMTASSLIIVTSSSNLLSLQCESRKSPPRFSFRLGIFSPNFARILYVPVYAGLQIFIQLSSTLTKLCHIKRDHPVHIMG